MSLHDAEVISLTAVQLSPWENFIPKSFIT